MVKPLLLNKIIFNEEINLLEDDNIVENDKNTASVLNEFFSNIITTLGIPRYNKTKPVSHKVGDPLMKAIIKYRFHPSINEMNEISNCKANKTIRSSDIPTKLVKESSDIFGDFVFGNYNNCVSYSIFTNSLKNTIIILAL